MTEIFSINSITEAYGFLSLGKPAHPLVAVVDNQCFHGELMQVSINLGLYVIALKEGMSGTMRYGRSHYDFTDGQMLFLAPGQMVTPADSVIEGESSGWTLLFHPDFIRRHHLASQIKHWPFFSYSMNESLHLSDKEKSTLAELIKQIQSELANNVDKHTERLICSTIELLLSHCDRFYDRQFYTRSNMNKDVIAQFEQLLDQYFLQQKQLEHGLPTVAYCAEALAISANYFSDLLKKETGKTAIEHIHLYVVEMAKNQLLANNDNVSQIAYNLGFDYPGHFSKVFKKTTKMTPSEFRKDH